MTEAQLGELSRTLFSPVTVLLYVTAMLLYLYAFSFIRRTDGDAAVAGTWARRGATALAGAGLVAHLTHLVTRSMASGGRVPWGNMFEFSSVMGFIVVAAGLLLFQVRMRRPEVMGPLLIGALLTMGAAMPVYTEPGPLQPILDSQWLKIHVLAIVVAFGVLTIGFVFNGLFLLRDTAERRVAQARTAGLSGSTVGAAYVGDTMAAEEYVDVVPQRTTPDPDVTEDGQDDREYRLALRAAVNPGRLALGCWLATILISWVWIAADPAWASVGRAVWINTVVAGAALLAWQFLPSLPSAATLDALTYRTIVFGFPFLTFAVLAGAVWAEQSWGRYWGWDPKETSAFLTWVAYAGYLHARATRGLRGRGAGWLGLLAYGVLLFTYFGVNLVITGLHSYGGLPG